MAEPVEVSDSSSAPLTDSCMLYMCVCIVSDINECVENRDNCEQLCNNRAGAFTCSCRPGYQLDLDGHSCTGKHCVGLNTVVFQESNISVVTASRQSVYGNMLFFYRNYFGWCHRIRGSSIHSNGGCGISRSLCYSKEGRILCSYNIP